MSTTGRACRSRGGVYCDQGVKCQICRDFDEVLDALEEMLRVEVADPGHIATLSAQHNAHRVLRAAGRLP